MTGFSIIGLVDPPGRVVAGAVRFKGRDLVGLPEEELRTLRGNRIAMIFQDPMMALNPVLRIDTQMVETIQAHRDCTRSAALGLARDALVQMGISSPERRLRCYPHELSGGMRQRIAIAIAFVNEPDLVIADEPTTALDVTIQAQILHEAQELCRRNHTAMIWITHDLAVVSSLADRVAVMYAGCIVEQGNARDLIRAPLHPYTKGLLGSVPSANRPGTRLTQIPGTMPSLLRSGARLPVPHAVSARGAGMQQYAVHLEPHPAPRGALLAAARGRACGVMSASAIPIIEARGLSKRFVRQPDLAERLLERLGASHARAWCMRSTTSAWRLPEGKCSAWSASSAAGSRRSAA